MQKLELYIGDEIMELSDDTPIALSFQINNLADVRNQNGNTSNQFKLPLTQRNRAILGFPSDTPFTTELPYRKYPAKVVQEGIEVIPNAFAEIKQSDDNAADITVLSGNVDFFDLLISKIYDMSAEFSPYEHVWNLANVVSSQTKTSGWLWPIINYGQFTGEIGEQCDVRNLRPAFYLKTVIDLIVATTNFTATGSLLTHPLYEKLIVCFANDDFEHGELYSSNVDNYSAAAVKTSSQFCTSEIREGDVLFSGETSDPSSSYDPGTSIYTAQEIITVSVLVQYDIQIRDIHSGGSPPTFKIRLQKYSGAVWTTLVENEHLADQEFTNIYFLGQTLSFDTELQIGEKLKVTFFEEPAADRINAVIQSGAKFTITNTQQDVIFGQKVQCEKIFPDITQKELLKDTFQKFGVICSSDNINKTITFAQFSDIVKNIPIANDWSDKIVDEGKLVIFQLGSYARINDMKYADDDAIPAGYGDSEILIDDETLQERSTLFESQFSASLPSRFNGMPCALIKKIPDGETDFSISTSPRILVDRKVDLANFTRTVTFTDGDSTSDVTGVVSLPTFLDTAYSDSLDWDYLRQTNYEDLENVLHRCKKIVRYFMLSPIDISALDLLIPIFLRQESAYFYINKIESWQNNKPVRVELIKLA